MAKNNYKDEYFEKLDRISRLRNLGEITESEYLKEKEKLDKIKKAYEKPVSNVTVLIILLLLVGFIAWLFMQSSDSSVNTKVVTAKIGEYRVINPSLISLEYTVTNTAGTSGYSSCSIAVNDASYTYTGSDFGYKSAKEIEPGDDYTGIANIKISNNGAGYITDGTIDCTIE